MFTRLVAGDLPHKGKRWPSDVSSESRLYLISGCTGEFTTSSARFSGETEIPADHAERDAAHKAAAAKKLTAFTKA